MPIIGNNGRSLLHGLSDFWLRFFKDIGDLETTYEGASIMLGQTYLNLLSDVLNTSIDDTPLFKKEYYRPITIREDQVSYVDTGLSGRAAYVVNTVADYGALPYLQNKVFEPTAGFEEGLDYTLATQAILFTLDPTGPIPDGFASRDVDILITGTFADGVDWVTAGVKKGDTLVVNQHYDVSVAVTSEPLGTRTFTVVKVEADRLILKAGATLPETLTGFSWRVDRTLTSGEPATGLPSAALFTGDFTATTSVSVREIALWAVDARVDDYRLYTVYGHYFGEKQASTELYRSLIRGLMQLYVYGPIIDRVESALNVIADLPVVRDDDEVLQSYDSGLDDSGTDGVVLGYSFTSAAAAFVAADVGGYLTITDAEYAVNLGRFQITAVVDANIVVLNNTISFDSDTGVVWEYSRTDLQTVVTDKQTYLYPRKIPMRDDVMDIASVGVLTFKAFEALTLATVVTDYIEDPEWWFHKTIPVSILPTHGGPRDRVASPQVLPNVIGDAGDYLIGAPGFYIGADEDGDTAGALFHHRAAFIMMDRFLKTHLMGVLIDRNVDVSGTLIKEMEKILLDLKPASSTIYFTPFTEFRDVVEIGETSLAMTAAVAAGPDIATQINNEFTIGSQWNIGDGWQFTDVWGGEITTGIGAGFMDIVIGGSDPDIAGTGDPAPDDPNLLVWADASEPIAYYIDRALYVNPRAP